MFENDMPTPTYTSVPGLRVMLCFHFTDRTGQVHMAALVAHEFADGALTAENFRTIQRGLMDDDGQFCDCSPSTEEEIDRALAPPPKPAHEKYYFAPGKGEA